MREWRDDGVCFDLHVVERILASAAPAEVFVCSCRRRTQSRYYLAMLVPVVRCVLLVEEEGGRQALLTLILKRTEAEGKNGPIFHAQLIWTRPFVFPFARAASASVTLARYFRSAVNLLSTKYYLYSSMKN